MRISAELVGVLDWLALASLVALFVADFFEHRVETTGEATEKRTRLKKRLRVAALASLGLLALFDVTAHVGHQLLDGARAPRHLSKDQVRSLVQALAKKPGASATVLVPAADFEAKAFAVQIADAMAAAGWTVERNEVTGKTMIGFVIMAAPDATGSCSITYDSALYRLAHALKPFDIGSGVSCENSRLGVGTPEHPIVVVGRNPRSPDSELVLGDGPPQQWEDASSFPPPP